MTDINLADRLSRFARVDLCHLPTPLEPMVGLGRHLGARLFIKRDDATGLAMGGNKARKLEFELGRWIADDAIDTIVTVGAVQSNHARQTAAAAARLGLRCELLLEDRQPASANSAYRRSGNVLLDHLLGAAMTVVPADGSLETRARDRVAALRAEGLRAVYIPGGASTAFGAIGYVLCAAELAAQCRTMGVRPRHVVHATGSGATQAGLVTGLKLFGMDVRVWGICHGPPPSKVDRIRARVEDLERALHIAHVVDPAVDLVTVGDYVGGGYGVPTDAMREALALVARLDGILLDPVYTGKAMAGLIDLVRTGRIPADEDVIFIHTGGAPGLFAYPDSLG